MHTEFWWGDVKKKINMEDQGVDGRIILDWIFIKKYEECGMV
jgi:hypothetical protein